MTAPEHRLYQQPWPEGDYRFFQLGFVVDDLERTALRWARVFGVGPFHLLPPMEMACTYRGAPSAVEVQIAVAQAGPVQIELIDQRCDRPSIYRDLFAKGDAGFHQLCTVTPDYDGKRAHFEGLGYALVCEIEQQSGRIAHYDTVADFGFFTEVAEQSPEFLDQLAAIARTCADWDGTEPIRRLGRRRG